MKKQLRFPAQLKNLPPEVRAALNLTAVQGFYWFASSFANYQTVYLQGQGMTASDIGTLNAISSLVAIVAMTFWGMVSDRINSIKKTFLISLTVGSALFALFPFLPTGASFSVALFFLYAPLVNFARCPTATLLDNITVRNCAEQRLNYGVIRSLGSFTFTIGSFLVVALIPPLGVGSTFWLSGILMVPTAVFLLFTHDPKAPAHQEQKEKKPKLNPGELFRNYFYMAFMIFTVILYIHLNGECAFIPYLMQDSGVNPESYGTVLAVRALMEIPFLIIIVKIRRRFKLKYLIMAACSLMGLECLYLGFFCHALSDILIGGAVFGLGNGIFLGTVSLYLYKLAPTHLKATAQTIFAAVSSVSGILGNLLGGFLYQSLGGKLFYVTLGIAIFLAVAVLAVSFLLRKNLPNPADSLD